MPLICKFVAKAAPVPDAATSGDAVVANNVEDPPPAAVTDPAPPPVPAEEASLLPMQQALKKPAQATPKRSEALQGQEDPGLIETCLSLHKCN